MVNFKLGEYTREMSFKSVTQAAQKKKIPITQGVQWHIVFVVVFSSWLYSHAHEHTVTLTFQS